MSAAAKPVRINPLVEFGRAHAALSKASDQREKFADLLLDELQKLPGTNRALALFEVMQHESEEHSLAYSDEVHVLRCWVRHLGGKGI